MQHFVLWDLLLILLILLIIHMRNSIFLLVTVSPHNDIRGENFSYIWIYLEFQCS